MLLKIAKVLGIILGTFVRRPLVALILALLIVGATYALADGSVSSPPVCEQTTSWKIVYSHETAPADGTPASAVVRIAYISNTGKILETEDITLTGADLLAFIQAQTAAASGENAGWGAGRKKIYRMSKWLVDNGKLTRCASCTVVG